MVVFGEVVELWRYPVKSLLGESCREIELERRGVVGDRRYAIQTADGKLASGKHTHRFRKIDGLFRLEAYCRGQIPQVKFPDGKVISGDDPDIDSALSHALGQPVKLIRETAVSHLDAAPVHILTRGWLARLRGIAPEGQADSRRFRPNILLATEDDGSELAWLGKRVRIGETELKFTAPTERCGMVTLPQGELPKAPDVLRHISQDLGRCFGVYGEVVKPGVIRLGDRVAEIDDKS